MRSQRRLALCELAAQTAEHLSPFAGDLPVGEWHDLTARRAQLHQSEVAGHALQRVGLLAQLVPVLALAVLLDQPDAVLRIAEAQADKLGLRGLAHAERSQLLEDMEIEHVVGRRHRAAATELHRCRRNPAVQHNLRERVQQTRGGDRFGQERPRAGA